jgi:hypothetical protein
MHRHSDEHEWKVGTSQMGCQKSLRLARPRDEYTRRNEGPGPTFLSGREPLRGMEASRGQNESGVPPGMELAVEAPSSVPARDPPLVTHNEGTEGMRRMGITMGVADTAWAQIIEESMEEAAEVSREAWLAARSLARSLQPAIRGLAIPGEDHWQGPPFQKVMEACEAKDSRTDIPAGSRESQRPAGTTPPQQRQPHRKGELTEVRRTLGATAEPDSVVAGG